MKISEPTLVLQGTRERKDCILSFLDMLKKVQGFKYSQLIRKHRFYKNDHFDFESQDAENLLEDLFAELNKQCGNEFMYFGNAEYGKEDLFGFWYFDNNPSRQTMINHSQDGLIEHMKLQDRFQYFATQEKKQRKRFVRNGIKVIYKKNN